MSRRRSAPAARGARAAAPQRGVYLQQPKSDVYVAMLGIALGAIILGCLLLVLVWGRYEYSTTVSSLGLTPLGPASSALASLPGSIPPLFG